ncbi:MAG: type II toxin-antitoxin system VapC family toxin [Tagaea sp.]|nr:type II toxin-antitoxin system VapC family toxin [Tagaea sp.]
MIACVADASALLKIVIDESDSNVARAFFLTQPTAAPALIRAEVANVLRRYVKSRKMSPEAGHRALRRLIELAELLPETIEEAQMTLDLAIALDHSAQDCRYLAAAIAAKVPLITADENFAAKARAAGHDARAISELSGSFG